MKFITYTYVGVYVMDRYQDGSNDLIKAIRDGMVDSDMIRSEYRLDRCRSLHEYFIIIVISTGECLIWTLENTFN